MKTILSFLFIACSLFTNAQSIHSFKDASEVWKALGMFSPEYAASLHQGLFSTRLDSLTAIPGVDAPTLLLLQTEAGEYQSCAGNWVRQESLLQQPPPTALDIGKFWKDFQHTDSFPTWVRVDLAALHVILRCHPLADQRWLGQCFPPMCGRFHRLLAGRLVRDDIALCPFP